MKTYDVKFYFGTTAMNTNVPTEIIRLEVDPTASEDDVYRKALQRLSNMEMYKIGIPRTRGIEIVAVDTDADGSTLRKLVEEVLDHHIKETQMDPTRVEQMIHEAYRAGKIAGRSTYGS